MAAPNPAHRVPLPLWCVVCSLVLLAQVSMAWECIEEGVPPNVPIPIHNQTYPGARMCKDQTPDRNSCLPLLWSNPACQGGYYLSNSTGIPQAFPCPPGYYCPKNNICLVPCPLGAYCVRATRNVTVYPPKVNCEPNYKTQQTMNRTNIFALTCGGPAALDDTVICKKGYYCPNVSTQILCPKGSYCRAGRVTPQPCPLLSSCEPGTSAPLINGIGLIFDFFLIILVILFYLALKYKTERNKFLRKHILPRLSNSKTYGIYSDDEEKEEAAYTEMGILQKGPDTVPYGSTDGSRRMVDRKDFTLEVMFCDLSLTLKGSKKKVLNGATGQLRPKTLTAIMGGSGAGKTTLLNALSGKAYYGIVEGTVEINGQAADISRYRSVMGFVPQEDTMHRELTTREVLYYQGILRLSGFTTFDAINSRVDEVLELLGLSHIKDSQIGDEEKRGISGGQRKRVNIGMELVADPTLLFLDEPTSGLDSVSSMQVCEALKRVAEEGHLTVVAVLHQPRFEIFQMFHEVILLQPGGSIAFQGSTQQAQEYFGELGYPCRQNVNPSDHYLDVIDEHNKKAEQQGKKASSNSDSVDAADGQAPTCSLGELWSMRQASTDGGTTAGPVTSIQSSTSGQAFAPRMPTPFHIQLFFFLRRAMVLQVRQLGVLILDQLLVLISGAVLGALYNEILLRKLALLLCMTSMAVALTSMLAALRCFGSNKPVFWRESAAGVNRPAYFLAVNISQIPIILLTPLVFLSFFYTLVSPRAYFRDYYLAVLMLVWASHGLGYAVSTIFNQRSSQMATVVLVLVSAMLSGAQPSLCKMNKLIIGPVLYSLSFARWFVEALFEKEANRYPGALVNEVATYSSYQGYTLDNFATCISVIFAFGIGARVIALLCLMFKHRGQQK